MRKENTILKTSSARVSVVDFPANTDVPWHFHSNITDDIFCLQGRIEIQLEEPNETVILDIGQRCTIQSKRRHYLKNISQQDAQYLLVQGVGKYDFISC